MRTPSTESKDTILITRKTNRSWRTALAAVGLLLSSASPSVQAVVVNIDTSRSVLTFTSSGPTICDPFGNCSTPPAPQTFALSGSFDVKEETVSFPYWFDPTSFFDLALIRFEPLSIDTGGAAALGFVFPAFSGIVTGTTFTASDDPCFLYSGGCSGWSLVNSTYTGDFDGQRLSLTGESPLSVAEGFKYTIVATAVPSASVAEPGSLACLAAAGAGLTAVRSRRRRTSAALAPGAA